MKKLFVLCTMLLWVAINALAQQKISVSGIVTDENKEPVIGANVGVKRCPRARNNHRSQRTICN